jgi:hypothetical protein
VSISRTAIACALACGLLAIAAATATANPVPYENYLNSYGSPPAADLSTASAHAQEQYYSSYGTPASHEPSGQTPWPAIALVPVAILVAASAVGATRRRRRPHAARSVPA